MPNQTNQPLPERSGIDKAYQWDLSKMYKNDAAWEQELTTLDAKVAAVAAWQGKLNNAAALHGYYTDATALSRTLSNLYCYASMRRSEDTRAEAAQSMYARIGSRYVAAVTALAFAEPEILALPEATLQALTDDPVLAQYRFSLQNLLRQKPHTLSAEVEQLMASFGEVFGAPSEIADNLQDADLVFGPAKNSAGQDVEVVGANFITLQGSTDRTLRKNAFASYYKAYRQHANTFAAAYAGAVKGAVAEAAARHYPSSRAMSMAGENIPAAVYDNLVAAVRGHMAAMHRYVVLRKKLLGVKELHYYDLYAPLCAGVQTRYSYDQAKALVLAAVAPIGEEYCGIVKKGFAERWVDVLPNKGKSGGAYSSGTYDSNPYILTNFTGTLDSVSTIAHEMGHSLHTWFSNHSQPPQYASYTLFVAEVASTVNENLLIEHLLQGETEDATRLSLLNQYLENFKGTVYRQTMFAEFEREVHAMAERGEALNPAALNALYRSLVADYFGEALVLDEEVQYEWARIPHFYRPFYVYKYATGYATAVALSEKLRGGKAEDVTRYLEFLSMGGSAYPLDELRHAGVDLTSRAPIDAALQKFERILDDAEATVARIAAAGA